MNTKDIDEMPEDSESKTYKLIKATTADAMLFDFGPNSAWLPKSQISVDQENLEVIFPAWITLNYINN